MSHVNINLDRRRFLGTAAMTLASAQFSTTDCENAQASEKKSADLSTMKPGMNMSFGVVLDPFSNHQENENGIFTML